MVTLSQLSQGSATTTASQEEEREREEERNKIIVEKALQKYVAKQRKEIKDLNRTVAKIAKERDGYVKEIEASTLQTYEVAVKAAESYFKETKKSATEVCKQTVINLDKKCHTLLEEMNRESEAIDEDDAEEVAESLAADFSDDIRQRNRWRRRVVKDNYNELKEQQLAVQNALNADELLKATMVLLTANTVM